MKPPYAIAPKLNFSLRQDRWVLEYDKPTGFPSRTSYDKSEAARVFGDDASYFRSGITREFFSDAEIFGNPAIFMKRYKGLLGILVFFLGTEQPFCISACFTPGEYSSYYGVRSCRREDLMETKSQLDQKTKQEKDSNLLKTTSEAVSLQKICAVCGESVPQDVTHCPKCGNWIFETQKSI